MLAEALLESFICHECGSTTALDCGRSKCCKAPPRCETCDVRGVVDKDPLADRIGCWCPPCLVRLRMLRGQLPIDPLRFLKWGWPEVEFYLQQQEILKSVFANRETFVVAGNKLGKDFVAGAAIVSWFLTGGGRGFKTQTRIVTTSVNAAHLDVLWGEVHSFIELFESTGRALRAENGGPLVVLQQEIRKLVKDERGKQRECPKSYIKAVVGNKAQNMKSLAGHHCQSTLAVMDECSGIDSMAYKEMLGWAKSLLAIGNADDCPHDHFFRKGIRDGDIVDPASLLYA